MGSPRGFASTIWLRGLPRRVHHLVAEWEKECEGVADMTQARVMTGSPAHRQH